MNPLQIRGLVKKYPDFTLNVDISIPRGFVTGFVGANGAGKTTTIKCALGLVHPDHGEVSIADSSRLGVVLDSPPYPGEWTVGLMGRVMARFYPSWDSDRFVELTSGAEIPSSRRIRELSRGMGMKLQLAVALSHDADFLILDEPTSGLDPYARDELLDNLAQFMVDETHTILFSTHITSDLERIADYITVINHGRILHSSTKDELQSSYQMIAGPPANITTADMTQLIGLRQHATGWDALAATQDLAKWENVKTQTPTLNDIVVRLTQEHLHD